MVFRRVICNINPNLCQNKDILFAPDSNSQSGKLVLPSVEESFDSDWTATTSDSINYLRLVIPSSEDLTVLYYYSTSNSNTGSNISVQGSNAVNKFKVKFKKEGLKYTLNKR